MVTKGRSESGNHGSALRWGVWHDPGTNKRGCTKNRAKAIEGYERFISLNNLRSLIQKYDESERDKKKIEADKAVLISDFEEELYKNEKTECTKRFSDS